MNNIKDKIKKMKEDKKNYKKYVNVFCNNKDIDTLFSKDSEYQELKKYVSKQDNNKFEFND